MKHRGLIGIVFVILISGFVRGNQPAMMRSPDGWYWSLKNVKKVGVVCVQGDPKTNQQLESYMVAKLHDQGIVGLGVHGTFPITSAYSADSVAMLLRKAGYDGLMLLTYKGDINQAISSKMVSFKIYSLTNWKTRSLSKNYGAFNPALIALIVGLASH